MISIQTREASGAEQPQRMYRAIQNVCRSFNKCFCVPEAISERPVERSEHLNNHSEASQDQQASSGGETNATNVSACNEVAKPRNCSLASVVRVCLKTASEREGATGDPTARWNCSFKLEACSK